MSGITARIGGGIAALTACICLSVGHAGAAYTPAVPQGYFGISAPELTTAARDISPKLQLYANGIQDAGLDFVRATVDWREVEPVQPVVPGVRLYNWGATDRLVTALAQRGIQLVPNLNGTPAWAKASDAFNCTDRMPAVRDTAMPSFSAFSRAVVQRYGPGGTFWALNPLVPKVPISRVELWNEPNWSGSWCPAPQPDKFAALVTGAARAIKATDPTIQVALGGLVMAKDNILFPNGSLRGMAAGTFLSKLVAAQPTLPSYLDEVAVHLYDRYPEGDIQLLGWIRQQITAAGMGNPGLFISEVGWHTSGGTDSLTEDARAQAYTELMDRLPRTDCGVTAVAPYAWATPEVDPNNAEDWFGVADPNTGALHPTGAAYRDAVALYNGQGSSPPPTGTVYVCGSPPPAPAPTTTTTTTTTPTTTTETPTAPAPAPADSPTHPLSSTPNSAPAIKIRKKSVAHGRANVRFAARDDGGPVETSCRVRGRKWRFCGRHFVTQVRPHHPRTVEIRASDLEGQTSVRDVRLTARGNH